ncbi:IS21-like element helper ATPase IstB [Anaerococcus tetradius]|uniref:IstB-like ATP-binding protein n=1 Tax=Anaerococcus tetradius ATCC 35098 TaxID=525255 RepID=C2CJ38_9FIRM|nr:IS21-like element helper ATPase IstB [Anaerococcus tetradius]EEI82417.1 IstB-like ATP-binding protein [Anaerococcus tetradius ATCC 35098]
MIVKETSNYLRLKDNLEYLKLKQFTIHIDEFLADRNTSLVEALLKLTDYEVDTKRINAANQMVKTAAFPALKDITSFDFTFQPSIDERQIKDLCQLGFLENNENIVFLGSSGVGKTHLSISIGIEAARQRYSTYFIKCSNLLENLKKAKDENRLEARLKHYASYRLLIIDELGYLPISEGDERLLFQLIDRRYEKKSTIVSTNINFSDWESIFYDVRIANAILDRILHHCSIIQILGESYRLKDIVKSE